MLQNLWTSRAVGQALASIAMTLMMASAAAAQSAAAAAAPAPPQQPSANPMEADGTVNVPGFRLPPSVYLSPEARAAMPRRPTDPEAPMIAALAAGKAGEMRARIGEFMAPQIKHLTDRFPVTLTDTTLGGVPAVDIKPRVAGPSVNAGKILLNLPGGGFVMGTAHGTGMLESIPLAAMAGVEIVSITYRQGPEYKYPAANEDVVAAYRALLETHRPQDIGVFGCSAGGLLSAEATGWFLKAKLPLPAAIGIFCASGDARFAGDSHHFSRPFQAIPPRDGGPTYFDGTDLSDPLISPLLSPALLRQFPPTLIISSTRAMDMSSAVDTHRELVKAGVDAQLHLWDGLGHAFFYNIDLPESREAFDVMTRFFTRCLHLVK